MKRYLLIPLFVLGASFFAVPQLVASNEESEIKDLLARWQRAATEKDLDGVMACYAPGDLLVAFDIVPPLACVGKDAYRKNYADFFAGYDGPLEWKVRDARIIAGSDVAFYTALESVTGTLKGGQKTESWMRVTSGFRRIKGKWLIVHDHVSVPTDYATGNSMLNLKP
jgi:uncharacterized protein (TIGR02246 family)